MGRIVAKGDAELLLGIKQNGQNLSDSLRERFKTPNAVIGASVLNV